MQNHPPYTPVAKEYLNQSFHWNTDISEIGVAFRKYPFFKGGNY